MRNTKEEILYVALSLFSIKGYDGISMAEIANSVGIKAASIYKHYLGKDDIFCTIVQRFEEKMESIFQPVSIENTKYINISKDMLITMIQQTFQLFAEETFISKCRKLFMISSFDRPDIGALYTKYFIEMPIDYQSKLFLTMQKENVFPKKDAQIMAYHFYASLFVLLQTYDYKNISMKEALLKIEQLVNQFWEVYSS